MDCAVFPSCCVDSASLCEMSCVSLHIPFELSPCMLRRRDPESQSAQLLPETMIQELIPSLKGTQQSVILPINHHMSNNDGQITSSINRTSGLNNGSTSTWVNLPPQPQTDTIQAGLDTINEQRRGTITTSQATLHLYKLLPDPSSIHALNQYTKKLDKIDQLHFHGYNQSHK